MYSDGLKLTGTSQIQRTILDAANRGNTLPASGSEGQRFELLVQDGSNVPGIYVYSGGAWKSENPDGTIAAYDVGTYWDGKPDASKVILRFVAVRSFTINDNFVGSKAQAGTAATATAAFTIKVNGTTIGTFTFAASGTSAVFAKQTGANMKIVSGDIVTVTAPASQDSTLADITFTFAASAA